MKAKSIISAATTLLGSALLAGAQTADAPVTITTSHRAVPIRSVARFSSVFDAKLAEKLSEVGSASRGPRPKSYIDHTVLRDFFDKYIVYIPNSSLAPSPTIDEVASLRLAIRNRCEAAAATKEALSNVAEGEISADFFVGKVKPAGK